MSQQIKIEKTVYNKDYNKVVNNSFSQLIKPEEENTDIIPTIDDFFELYENLFYQIPKEGDINSHKYLISKSSEYLGISEIDIESLLAEITTLRQELLDANTQINELLKNQ